LNILRDVSAVGFPECDRGWAVSAGHQFPNEHVVHGRCRLAALRIAINIIDLIRPALADLERHAFCYQHADINLRRLQQRERGSLVVVRNDPAADGKSLILLLHYHAQCC